MSISKAYTDLKPSQRLMLDQLFANPEMREILHVVVGWTSEQLASLDCDSPEFQADYRRLHTTRSVIEEFLNLTKQETIHHE